MSPYNVQFGKRVRSYRKLAGITQKELAEKLDLTESAINKYENGKVQSVDIDLAERIANVLRVKPEKLMGWSDDNGGYYFDDELVKQMQEDNKNPRTRFLMDANRRLSKEGYDKVKDFIEFQLQKEGQLDD